MKYGKQHVLCVLFIIAILFFWRVNDTDNTSKEPPRIRSSSSPNASVQMKKGRDEYFYMLLRDPHTNQIPANIRQKELEFARSLRKLSKSVNIMTSSWKEAGPYDVGGRTRALAVDLNNSSTIISGGVSGGIWKSTDNGYSWKLKSKTSQVLSVTSIAQDPRDGFRNVWYYVSGEFSGTGFDIGYTARYFGDGVYKSTDNGETWNILPSTHSKNQASWEGYFDNTSKVVVTRTGSVLVAANAFGIFRSADGGNTFTLVLGGQNQHIYSDIVAASSGTLIAVVSSPFQGYTPANKPGIYKSTDDGLTWTNITPLDFPTQHLRSVLAAAPSNPDVLYSFTFTGQKINERDEISFHKINVSNGQSENRSTNMPNLGSSTLWGGYIETQGGYNMILAVKPDDENFVLLGATCLFRSTNGFAAKPNNKSLDWIGGYDTQKNGIYPGFHCDIHSFCFDPADPNKMWWGHDGGLSYTNDIRNTSYSTYFPWQNKNNGYNVTQFYMVTIPESANDNRIMGGTQDNGTPFFTFDGKSASTSFDASSGDGAFAYFGKSFAFVSSQNGRVRRIKYDGSGNPSPINGWSTIYPLNAKNQFFINPYAVDPNDENVMYYPAGNVLWRNNQLSSIPDYQNGTTTGWQQLTDISVPSGYIISAVGISTTPSHILYFGASSNNNAPKLFKLSNSASATSGAVEVSVSDATAGSFINNIAVNPDNADEILVVISNYNVIGLYHSTNGGQSYTAVEGNLEGTKSEPGPSLRAATIKNTDSGPVYLLATSIGVFSATKLNGSNTVWTQEGENIIGNVIVNYIASRKSDSRVVAGTHGRGAFAGDITAGTGAIVSIDVLNVPIKLETNTKASSTFTVSNTGAGPLNFNVNAEYKGKAPDGSVQPKIFPKAAYPNGKNSFGSMGLYNNNLKQESDLIKTEAGYNLPSNSISGNDILLLDNGDNWPDNFVGMGDGTSFTWFNEFDLNGFGFKLEKVNFYMRTESAFLNSNWIIILDEKQDTLNWELQSFDTSPNGTWFTFTLPSPITFYSGQKFYIGIGTFFGSINYPAGSDSIAAVQGKSYFQDKATGQLVNMNKVSGLERTGFLIRAFGTKTAAGNQNPVAVAKVSKQEAEINEQVGFDGSTSYDLDGQIVKYLWNFGDGLTGTQKIVTHAYSKAGTFNYTLTVTDNLGATGQTNGQITIKGGTANKAPVAVAIISKTQALINESITFDASNSHDEDGQITSYEWNFNDGSTSTQKTAAHSYSQAKIYNWTLKVTDNLGAAGTTTGQITVTAEPNRLTVSPESGTIAPGESRIITVTFDAKDLPDGNYQGTITITSNGGDITLPVKITVAKAVIVSESWKQPDINFLTQNYPNPFNPETNITFNLVQSEFVVLTVYNIKGREVKKLIEERKHKGRHTIRFNAGNLSSGVYLYNLKAGSFSDTRKLILIK